MRRAAAWAGVAFVWSFAIALVSMPSASGGCGVGWRGWSASCRGVASPFAGCSAIATAAACCSAARWWRPRARGATAAAALGASGGVVFALAGCSRSPRPYVPARAPAAARRPDPQELAAQTSPTASWTTGLRAGALVDRGLLSATSREVVFGVAAAAGPSARLCSRVGGDERPVYAADTAGGSARRDGARRAGAVRRREAARGRGGADPPRRCSRRAADVFVVLIASICSA